MYVVKVIAIFLFDVVFAHLMYRVKYTNKEKEEQLDKCLICPNHSNMLEPFWIYVKTPNTWVMAKAEMFKYKLIGGFFRFFNVFPIRRGEKDARSIIHAINIVTKTDKVRLLIFPEGTRIPKEKERGEAKVGPVYIAAKTNVPIVPAYITKNAKLFRRVEIIYGDPIYLPEGIDKDKEKVQEYSNLLLDKIYALKEEAKYK